MKKLSMQLYIYGRSMRSDKAITNLELILSEYGFEDYELSIIDVLTDPQKAEDNFILATPTLVKLEPLPQRRTIGDLSDRDSLLQGLDLSHSNLK